jgi:hypothetical protein
MPRGDAQCHCLGYLDAIDGRGQDAAGIAGAFAGGIETGGVEALQAVVAFDPHRRRGARLHAGKYGIVQGETLDLPIERGQRLADRGDRVIGQCAVETAQRDARLERWLDLTKLARCSSGDKVADQLARRVVVFAAQYVYA